MSLKYSYGNKVRQINKFKKKNNNNKVSMDVKNEENKRTFVYESYKKLM